MDWIGMIKEERLHVHITTVPDLNLESELQWHASVCTLKIDVSK